MGYHVLSVDFALFSAISIKPILVTVSHLHYIHLFKAVFRQFSASGQSHSILDFKVWRQTFHGCNPNGTVLWRYPRNPVCILHSITLDLCSKFFQDI
jgi:hypothetical protein